MFCKSTKKRSLHFGFLCAKTGLPFLLNGKVVKLPYFCSEAKSTVMSSLKLIGVGRI